MDLDLIRTELTVLKLEAGDVLAVRLPPETTTHDATAVHNTVKALLPPGVRIMTFRGAVGLEVIQSVESVETPEHSSVDASDRPNETRRKRGVHAES